MTVTRTRNAARGEVRLPMDQLLASARVNRYGWQDVIGNGSGDICGEEFTIVELAHQLGTTPRTIHRYISDGVPESVADRWCAVMGLWPGRVWPEHY